MFVFRDFFSFFELIFGLLYHLLMLFDYSFKCKAFLHSLILDNISIIEKHNFIIVFLIFIQIFYFIFIVIDFVTFD
jgi:hypothetical protein